MYIQKLERTLKRAESSIHRAAKEALEREALAKVRHEERIKRSKGKGAWYLKKGVHVITERRVLISNITPSRRAREDQTKSPLREYGWKGSQKSSRKEAKKDSKQRKEGETIWSAITDVRIRREEEGLDRRSGE